MSNEKEKIIIENLENLTLDQAVEYHRILWRGIAEEIEELEKEGKLFLDSEVYGLGTLKMLVLNKIFYIKNDCGFGVFADCFLCQYVKNLKNDQDACLLCPFMNPNSRKPYRCLNGRYESMCLSIIYEDFRSAKKIALEIAELPVVNR